MNCNIILYSVIIKSQITFLCLYLTPQNNTKFEKLKTVICLTFRVWSNLSLQGGFNGTILVVMRCMILISQSVAKWTKSNEINIVK